MRTYKLYNFKHPFKDPTEVQIGLFTVAVDEVQCLNVNKMKKYATYSFTFDSQNGPGFVENESVQGEIVETAFLRIEDSAIVESALLPAGLKKSNVDDFLYLLSFLTGYRVYTEEELCQTISLEHIDKAVSERIFQRAEDFTANLMLIGQHGLGVQFCSFANLIASNDLIGKSFYANSILNAIYEEWCSCHSKTKFEQKSLLEKAQETMVDWLRKNLFASAKRQVLNWMSREGVDNEVIQDIEARFKELKGPSAIYKLRSFLIGIGLYPANCDNECFKRLKWLNIVRNRVAHAGDIPSDKHYSYLMRLNITVDITFLLITIIQYYFASEILEIEDPILEADKSDVLQFFRDGTFRGKKVFDETFEEYYERVKDEWLN